MEQIKTTQEKIEAVHTNYNWFIEEAESIVRELKQGKTRKISETYLLRKLQNVKSILHDLKVAKQRGF